MGEKKAPVVRYDCTSGGAQFCQGCYTMEESDYGDYVTWEEYMELVRVCKSALAALKGREHDGFLRDAISRAEAAQRA